MENDISGSLDSSSKAHQGVRAQPAGPPPSPHRHSLLLSTCEKGKIHLSPETANGKAIAQMSD